MQLCFHIIYNMSALWGGVRTMELIFDYKIKFSEKVYIYILQKRAWA